MKTWHFRAKYYVWRACSITAETEQEAIDAFQAQEWDEGQELDSCMESVTEPEWADDGVEE